MILGKKSKLVMWGIFISLVIFVGGICPNPNTERGDPPSIEKLMFSVDEDNYEINLVENKISILGKVADIVEDNEGDILIDGQRYTYSVEEVEDKVYNITISFPALVQMPTSLLIQDIRVSLNASTDYINGQPVNLLNNSLTIVVKSNISVDKQTYHLKFQRLPFDGDGIKSVDFTYDGVTYKAMFTYTDADIELPKGTSLDSAVLVLNIDKDNGVNVDKNENSRYFLDQKKLVFLASVGIKEPIEFTIRFSAEKSTENMILSLTVMIDGKDYIAVDADQATFFISVENWGVPINRATLSEFVISKGATSSIKIGDNLGFQNESREIEIISQTRSSQIYVLNVVYLNPISLASYYHDGSTTFEGEEINRATYAYFGPALLDDNLIDLDDMVLMIFNLHPGTEINFEFGGVNLTRTVNAGGNIDFRKSDLVQANSNIDGGTVLTMSANDQTYLLGEFSPFEIRHWKDLQAITSQDLSASYTLKRSISFPNPGDDGFGSDGFQMIGNLINPFLGSFNGEGNTISNFYINRPSETRGVGLFGVVGDGMAKPTIRNFFIEVRLVVGGDSVGVLIGRAQDVTISQMGVYGMDDDDVPSSSQFQLMGTSHVGGIVGRVHGCDINQTYAELNIKKGDGSGNKVMFGGIIGSAKERGIVTNCYTTGKIETDSLVGGIVGSLESGSVSKSYSVMEIEAITKRGPIVGVSERISLNTSLCYFPSDPNNEDLPESGQIDISRFVVSPGETTEKREEPFRSWDFKDVWMFRFANWPLLKEVSTQ